MGVTAQQTPNTQILPLVPSFPDLTGLWTWAQDLNRTLQQNLDSIARKANDTSTYPLSGDLDGGGFNIKNVKGVYISATPDTILQWYNATSGHAALMKEGIGGNTSLIFDAASSVGFVIDTDTTANILAGTNTGATVRWTLSPNGTVTMTNGLSLGSAVGSSGTDVTRHIALYGTAYGFGITGFTLNYVVPATAVHNFIVNGVSVANFSSTALTTNGSLAIAGAFSGATTGSFTGLLTASGGISVSGGTVNINSNVGSINLGNTDNHNQSVEIGYTGGTNTVAAIDFHTSASAVDYDVRLIATGNTGTVGGGTLTVQAAGFVVQANNFTVNSGGTVSAGNYQVGGVQIPFSRAYESAQQTITSAGALTLAHGLGVKPKLYFAVIQCTTAELGYSIGDELGISVGHDGSSGEAQGISVVPDATNLNVRMGAGTNAWTVIRKDTGVNAAMTRANWKLVLRAWA
jgi:hypothetical protein